MSKYQKEIESLLNKSESNITKDLKKLYKDLANEITQEIVALAEQIEKDDKFSKKLQKERLESIRSQMYAKANQLEGDQQDKAGDLFIGGEKIWCLPQDPKIIIGKYELKAETLEKLIEFAESGKLDEIMEQGI